MKRGKRAGGRSGVAMFAFLSGIESYMYAFYLNMYLFLRTKKYCRMLQNCVGRFQTYLESC